MSNPTSRFATAIHESSHAVCTLSFGLPVDRLSLRTDGLGGVCTFRHSGATPEQVASIYLAGTVGERMMEPCTNINTARTDIAEAAKLAQGFDLDAIVFRVRRRLYSLWDEVSRLAESLDQRGELTAAEILRTARMPPAAWLG